MDLDTSENGQGRAQSGVEKPPVVVVDYFCGAGGFTCGSLMAGAAVACGVDIDERAKKTFKQSNRNADGRSVPFLRRKVEELDTKIIARLLRKYESAESVFVGCPPCTPHTNLRTNRSTSADLQEALLAFTGHVVELKPSYVVVENVPGIQRTRNGSIWREALSELEGAGYEWESQVVDAARYSVPQRRRRRILLASRLGRPPWPKPQLEPDEYQTVKDALEGKGLEELEQGATSETDPMHTAAKLSKLNLKRIRAIKEPGGSRSSWPKALHLTCYKEHKGHTDVYGRMDWKRPAPTLTTRFDSLSNGRFGHPDEDRAITPREGALLQSFPIDYEFLDPARQQNVRHIGNAVPPALAQAIIESIIAEVRKRA